MRPGFVKLVLIPVLTFFLSSKGSAQTVPANDWATGRVLTGDYQPYESETFRKVRQLREKTTSDYVDHQTGAASRVLMPYLRNARTASSCESTFLCRQDALPVTLVSFSGKRTEPGLVLLTWETTSESNNKGFEIERSFSGAAAFDRVGFIAGTGNPDKLSVYDFTDHNPSRNLSYYRLKQLDGDGTFSYSDIVAIAGAEGKLSVVAVPNPMVQKMSYFQVTGIECPVSLDFSVVDASGTTVFHQNKMVVGSNGRIRFFDLPVLRPGMYVGKIVSEGVQSVVRFVVAD